MIDTGAATSPRWRRFLRWLLRLRGSPEAIALGVAIGVFISVTPTLGFQMILAALLATVFNANRPAAIAMACITNPVTIPPIFLFTYWVGARLWGGPGADTVAGPLGEASEGLASVTSWNLLEQLQVLAALGWDLLAPLWVGGIVVGVFASAVSYAITLRGVRALRARRHSQRGERRRRAARLRQAMRRAGPGS